MGATAPASDSSCMPPAASYKTRMAVAEDAPNLRRLAALDSQSPLSGAVLMGEIDGMRAAALTGERRTSLRERLLGGVRIARPATPRVA